MLEDQSSADHLAKCMELTESDDFGSKRRKVDEAEFVERHPSMFIQAFSNNMKKPDH